MSTEEYKKSLEIEMFLKEILKVQPDSKVEYNLKDLYRTVKFYEQGLTKVSPSVHKKTYARYMSYFGKAMDKLIKKNPSQASKISELKARLPEMETAADMLWLYEQLRATVK